MNEIICPNCNKAFKIDEAGYADILKQVRDRQFEEDVKNRLDLAEKEKVSAVKLAEVSIKNSLQGQLAEKDRQLTELKAKSETQLAQKLAEKETEITRMEAAVESAEVQKKLAVKEAVQEVEKERDKLVNDVQTKELEKQNLENSLKQQYTTELQNKDAIIKHKDDEIARVKDMKQRLSTKMLGETLEQHCEIEFNKLRPTAFPNAYFEKDNDASGGTKGDYIFKETDEGGNEIISIMFEMKNENDETANRKKNEDFFAKLDKDRKDKNCEYAVLVSLLESDNELYNNGIVDVSYKYEKMYVIRPQFFIPIITLLKNAALNSLEYKQELNLIRNQNIDISNFEDKINTFRDGFAKNYISASDHFQKAIEEIDKSIARMQKVKQELTTSENQLRLANKKAEDLTIKKLTYNNPTMKQKFNDLRER
ncbi:MAG: DUF2130 domain-containing protein [Ekhidna sp.]|nr:DUF2130 domain-containing protein [Ekhidna sp.]